LFLDSDLEIASGHVKRILVLGCFALKSLTIASRSLLLIDENIGRLIL